MMQSEYAETLSTCCGAALHRPAGSRDPWFCQDCGTSHARTVRVPSSGDRVERRTSKGTVTGTVVDVQQSPWWALYNIDVRIDESCRQPYAPQFAYGESASKWPPAAAGAPE